MLAVLTGELSAIFVAAFVHVYWALGGRVAKVVAISELRGTPAFVPGSGFAWLDSALYSPLFLVLPAGVSFIGWNSTR